MRSAEVNPDPAVDRLVVFATGAWFSIVVIGAVSASTWNSAIAGGVGAAPFGGLVGCVCGAFLCIPIASLIHRKHMGWASVVVLVPTVAVTTLVSMNGWGMPLSGAATCGGMGLLMSLAVRFVLPDIRLPSKFDCASCGYDLRGLSRSCCPECGAERKSFTDGETE